MKKHLLSILFICNCVLGSSQLIKTAEFKLEGTRDLYKINQHQLLITQEIMDTAGYTWMELSLYDSTLSQVKLTRLKKLKGHFSEVFITPNRIYVLYWLSYDAKLPPGTTRMFCLDKNLRVLSTADFALSSPSYSVSKLVEGRHNEVFMYGQFWKSSQQFIVKLNTRSKKLVTFSVQSSFRNREDDFDWVLEWESFPEDSQTFVVYNNEKGRNDSTYLRVYSNDGWRYRTLRIKLGDGMMMGSAQFYRLKKDDYILYGRYWHSATDYPDDWGIYLLRFNNGEVTKIITKSMLDFPLDDRRSLDMLGLPDDQTDLRMTLDSLRQTGCRENREMVIEHEKLIYKDNSYFLTCNIGRGDIEGGMIVQFDSSLQYKRSKVFPIVYGPRSGNHQYSDFPNGWTGDYFNQSYFLNYWLTGCLVDSSFNVQSYYSVNPDPSWSVVYPSKAMLWYYDFLVLYGNKDDWKTKSDTFFLQKLVLPVK